MLVKSFTDDLAWEVQRQLVNTYFRVREIIQRVPDSYMIDDPVKRAERWIEEQREKQKLLTTVAVQEQQIKELKPRADYTDKILQNKGLVTITQIAKDYGMSGKMLNKKLHELGVQYKQSAQWLLYAKYQDKGYTHSETVNIKRSDGRPEIKMNTKWTQKGRLFLYELLKADGVLPLIEQESVA
ncbi:MAG: phage antirepressor KilAC domain-containing protein [Ruminococcus sp.]|nr:phage antirepressor KilAC domain-containing protein [Ruminococcus sp.]